MSEACFPSQALRIHSGLYLLDQSIQSVPCRGAYQIKTDKELFSGFAKAEMVVVSVLGSI